MVGQIIWLLIISSYRASSETIWILKPSIHFDMIFRSLEFRFSFSIFPLNSHVFIKSPNSLQCPGLGEFQPINLKVVTKNNISKCWTWHPYMLSCNLTHFPRIFFTWKKLLFSSSTGSHLMVGQINKFNDEIFMNELAFACNKVFDKYFNSLYIERQYTYMPKLIAAIRQSNIGPIYTNSKFCKKLSLRWRLTLKNLLFKFTWIDSFIVHRFT